MNKTYILQIDCAEFPKGTEARWNEQDENYDIFNPNGDIDIDMDENTTFLANWKVENRPEVWKLVEEEKEVVENEFRAFIPKPEETFFYIMSDGVVKKVTNTCSKIDISCTEQGVYRTGHAAQMEEKRRESRANAWMPEDRKIYYFISDDGDIENHIWYCDTLDRSLYTCGNCHKDEQTAQKWKDDGYWEAFNCLF